MCMLSRYIIVVLLGLARGYGPTLAVAIVAESFLSPLNDLNDAIVHVQKINVFT